MLRRLPLSQALLVLETALVGVFFVQGLRYLIGALYAGFGSASLVAVLDSSLIPAGTPGAILPSVFSNQVSFVVYMLVLPLLALFMRRWRFPMVIAAIVVAVGRVAMINANLAAPIIGAAMTVGGGLLYIALLIRHRAQLLPYFFILALAIDQIFRALGNTLDPSWSPNTLVIDVAVSADSRFVINYLQFQVFLSVVTIIASVVNYLSERRTRDANVSPDSGLLPMWGGVGMGALLFLELSLLALPNAIAGRSSADYTTLVPFVLAATLLPLVPWVRGQARNFVALFDSQWRGWLWTGVIALLLVFGTRVQFISGDLASALSGVLSALGLAAVGRTLFNFIGAFLLVIAQFSASMLWWWMTRPQAERERNFTGLWLFVSVLVFAMFVGFDVFTYEYAYVRNLPADYDILNNTIIPVLRGFRGMGGLVLLFAVFLAGMPMALTHRRVPWSSGKSAWRTVGMLLFVAGASAVAAFAARPPLIQGERGDTVRVASYNIHSGYSEFYDYDLEAIARAIGQSGADVVMLQMTEAGRMTSFGVDQPLWLGRRLGMDVRFFPTNEGLQGLAVLSRVEIVFSDGNLLTSVGNQTGLQRIQIRPDNGVITIYNTWLGFLTVSPERPLEDQEQDQQRQLNEIYALICLQHPPDCTLGRTVLGGTFNTVPDSPLIQTVRDARFVDPVEGAPLELSATLRRTTQIARIDYIWIRNLSAGGWGVTSSGASDHGLVVVELNLGG
jgi:endonuclease/exonuclease/phosphatase family metal-dependent hydrolase